MFTYEESDNGNGVAERKKQMVKALPEELQSSLPFIEEIEKEQEMMI